jgi:hypothetical protein
LITRDDWWSTVTRTLGGVTNAHHRCLQLEVPDEDSSAINDAVTAYLRECVRLEYGGFLQGTTSGDLADNDLLRGLSNRTPNGVVVPKTELESQFDGVQHAVSRWFASLGIDHMVSTVFSPIHVRCVLGEEPPEIEERPYATSKMHLDVWSGDPYDCVIVTLPVLGDVVANTVEYYEAYSGIERELGKYPSFQAGHLDSLTLLPLGTEIGKVILLDATVPHKTVRKGGAARTLVEIRMRRAESGSTEGDGYRLESYHPLDRWYTLGDGAGRMKFDLTFEQARDGVVADRPHGGKRYGLHTE